MRRLLPVFPCLLAACSDPPQLIPKDRVLDSFPYVDCGVVAPLDRRVCTVPLFSEGDGPVVVYAIQSVDLDSPEGGLLETGGFYVNEVGWQDPACGEDGTCRQLEGYDDSSDEDTLPLEVVFQPQTEGFYRAELTIWTNDTSETGDALEPMPDDPDTEHPVWKVQLRGLSRPACGRIWPEFIDFGRRPVGGDYHDSARLDNCGIVSLAVGGNTEAGTGAEEMSILTSFPLYGLPGLYEEMIVGWSVGVEIDGEPTPVETTFTFSSNSERLDDARIVAIGNDCEQSVHESWDADRDGWSYCGGDCNDADATISRSQPERAANGVDDDCDGAIDEAANPQGSDDDGDGYSEIGGDCDDAEITISPDAVEVVNSIDDDCDDVIDNGTDRHDDDGDGYSEREGDSDDTTRLVAPDIAETADGIDNDGDGIIDEGYSTVDDDGDGYAEIDPVENDCDDQDPWKYVGAFEFCDGYDNDCDNYSDEGDDGEEDGACAFLPDRRGEQEVVGPAPGACSTAPAGGAAWAVLALAGALGVRRRRN